jgi:putative addiction module killer protein
MRELREYLTSNGKSPFADWLTSLKDVKARAIIRVRLDRASLGNLGDCKSVGGGVQELRIDFGPGYRVYLGQEGEVLILLLCGGTKKSQFKDIQKAKDYWQDYKERKNG